MQTLIEQLMPNIEWLCTVCQQESISVARPVTPVWKMWSWRRGRTLDKLWRVVWGLAGCTYCTLQLSETTSTCLWCFADQILQYTYSLIYLLTKLSQQLRLNTVYCCPQFALNILSPVTDNRSNNKITAGRLWLECQHQHFVYRHVLTLIWAEEGCKVLTCHHMLLSAGIIGSPISNVTGSSAFLKPEYNIYMHKYTLRTLQKPGNKWDTNVNTNVKVNSFIWCFCATELRQAVWIHPSFGLNQVVDSVFNFPWPSCQSGHVKVSWIAHERVTMQQLTALL